MESDRDPMGEGVDGSRAQHMRIAVITSAFPVLSETFVLDQVIGLLDRRHDVRVFSMHRPASELVHERYVRYGIGTRVTYLPEYEHYTTALRELIKGAVRFPWRTLQAVFWTMFLRLPKHTVFAVFPFCEAPAFDILYVHFGAPAAYLLLLKKIFQVPYLTYFHAYDVTRFPAGKPQIYRHLFQYGDSFLTNSRYNERKLLVLGAPPERTHVFPLGIDLQTITFRKRAPVPGEPLRVLTVARLIERKGIHYTIQAMAMVAAFHPQIQYDIIGDGPQRPHLQDLIGSLRMAERVHLLGAKSHEEVRRYLDKSHIFLLASVTMPGGGTEGTPVVLLEAQAAGLPVIATDTGGVSEIVQDGESGFVVPEKEVESIMNRINYLVTHPEIWGQMGEKGRKLVESTHDNNRQMERLEALFEELKTPKGKQGSTECEEPLGTRVKRKLHVAGRLS